MTNESTQPARVRTDRSRETDPALESHYRFLTWLIQTVERFPRAQKFLLGDRIQTSALDVLERLVEATYSKRWGDCLAGANLGIEKLRFLFRLGDNLRRHSRSLAPEKMQRSASYDLFSADRERNPRFLQRGCLRAESGLWWCLG